MTHFEADVPKEVENLFDHLRGVGRDAPAILVVEEHNVDVAEGVKLAPSISAERDDGERGGGRAFAFFRGAHRGVENVLEEDINQLDA